MKNGHTIKIEDINSAHFKQIEILQNNLRRFIDTLNRFNDTNMCFTDTSQFVDLNGDFTEEFKRIEFLKSQEQENIRLKNKISLIDSKFEKVVSNFNQKIKIKNSKIKALKTQLSAQNRPIRPQTSTSKNHLEKSLSELNMIKTSLSPIEALKISTPSIFHPTPTNSDLLTNAKSQFLTPRTTNLILTRDKYHCDLENPSKSTKSTYEAEISASGSAKKLQKWNSAAGLTRHIGTIDTRNTEEAGFDYNEFMMKNMTTQLQKTERK